jgi:hypothetical protein
MGRFFNIAGPCKADINYTIDPLRRLSGVRALVEEQKYFILTMALLLPQMSIGPWKYSSYAAIPISTTSATN